MKQAELRAQLQTTYDKRKNYMITNHSDVASGYTRLDAFGAILNQALLATGEKNNTNPLAYFFMMRHIPIDIRKQWYVS